VDWHLEHTQSRQGFRAEREAPAPRSEQQAAIDVAIRAAIGWSDNDAANVSDRTTLLSCWTRGEFFLGFRRWDRRFLRQSTTHCSSKNRWLLRFS
jgi:hypothetical protein